MFWDHNYESKLQILILFRGLLQPLVDGSKTIVKWTTLPFSANQTCLFYLSKYFFWWVYFYDILYILEKIKLI